MEVNKFNPLHQGEDSPFLFHPKTGVDYSVSVELGQKWKSADGREVFIDNVFWLTRKRFPWFVSYKYVGSMKKNVMPRIEFKERFLLVK